MYQVRWLELIGQIEVEKISQQLFLRVDVKTDADLELISH
jgi:hypothetical protein